MARLAPYTDSQDLGLSGATAGHGMQTAGARRIWTIIASAFLAIIVASQVAVVIDLRVTLGTLLISMAMWSYGVLACIAFGTWASWRARRAGPV